MKQIIACGSHKLILNWKPFLFNGVKDKKIITQQIRIPIRD